MHAKTSLCAYSRPCIQFIEPCQCCLRGDDDSPLSGGDDKNLTEFCLGKGTSKDV